VPLKDIFDKSDGQCISFFDVISRCFLEVSTFCEAYFQGASGFGPDAKRRGSSCSAIDHNGGMGGDASDVDGHHGIGGALAWEHPPSSSASFASSASADAPDTLPFCVALECGQTNRRSLSFVWLGCFLFWL
jgi:hypothetical protein